MQKKFMQSTVLVMLLMALPGLAMASDSGLEAFFGTLNGWLSTVIFFDVFPGEPEMPFIVAWLIVGAVFLTIRFSFVNLRMMGHAFAVLRGKYRTKDDKGEVTSFQALSTALSATVGLGNIAGVAIAISIGGPGAVFWMIVAGFLGMSTKFTEATLAQMYREVRPDGRLMGGAMEYLSKGFAEKGMVGIGKFLAVMFAVFAIFGSFGAGSAFQVSQSLGAVKDQIPFFAEMPIAYGILMAVLTGLVIIGGLRRIAQTAEAIVPTMVIVYLLACLWIILNNISGVPDALSKIFVEAFSPIAVAGGIVGAIVQGFKRAAFSSEAGLGSAAIVHSTASVKYPVRQGMVALYEPFIDTVIICTMTALVIILTGVYNSPETEAIRAAKEGAALTAVAFRTVADWFPIILTLSVFLFAYSTMIAWSYYGERCWVYLFGEKLSIIYKVMFLLFIVLASVVSAANMLDFTDLLVLAMAFPNLIGLYLLSGKVRSALNDYTSKLKSGELDREALR
ncbi:alanine/glycine:cation symporter family protein [Candidatus Thiothrix anitrata]|uniref:Alanine:cation symporter family protein n=1 Tax=Candidatus Thiothrix anitrata TaxID=2823902 RepID=A0ABX7X8T2_9GAMM|nr:alanine/glycine:cation symporter family protein [Candidatus Thiothrix anitrata]QTR51629.1 alanine:cation symporter family protein [Candidatus Thiothrix anitrata]